MITVESTSTGMIVRISNLDVPEFKQAIQRAANLWPDASAEFKRFADTVTLGYVQQEYADDPPASAKWNHQCTRCGKISQWQTRDAKPPSYFVSCDNRNWEVTYINEKGETVTTLVVCKNMEMFNPAKEKP